MPWEPDMDTALRLTWFTAAVFFLIFLVSLIGELLGWWDLVGEIGIGVGAGVSILLTLIGALAGAGRHQVSALGENVGSVGKDVRSVGEDIQSVGQDVQSVGEDVQSVGQDVQSVGEDVQDVHQAVLANGRKLGKLDQLDIIQAELDAQTGVLGEQLAVLRELRDQG